MALQLERDFSEALRTSGVSPRAVSFQPHVQLIGFSFNPDREGTFDIGKVNIIHTPWHRNFKCETFSYTELDSRPFSPRDSGKRQATARHSQSENPG